MPKELFIEESKEVITELFATEITKRLKNIGTYLLRKYEELSHVGIQDAQDVENEADLRVAQFWVNVIQKIFPSFNIDTEEALGKINKGGEYTVRIDSIDGSKHFLAGIPLFGSNISLHHKNETLFGACVHPMTGEIYHATKGKGAYRNGKKIFVSQVSSIQKTFIALEGPTSKLAKTNPEIFQTFIRIQNYLKEQCFRVRDFGLGAFGICLVANGSCGGYVDLSGTTKIYDIEAALLILEEAGGRYIEYILQNDEEDSITNLSGQVLIASNNPLQQELLDVITSAIT